ESPRHLQGDVFRLHLRRAAADPNVVQRVSVAAASPSEYLARCRQVAEHDAVECHNGDHVAAPASAALDWPESCEHCLFSHWLSLPYFVGSNQKENAMHSSPPLLVTDYIGPALGAVIFVLVMSLVKEPTRRTFNALFVAGASGVYLSGGFGPWELLYPAIATPV